MQQPEIILLKEPTDTSQCHGQMLSNISACTAVADTMRASLGPRGLDRLLLLIHGDKGATISNDGATIMHPAAKIPVDIAKSQDSEQPQIILLKEGTDMSQDRWQMLSNISVCTAVADTVPTTLGPHGLDKLIHEDKGSTISIDGTTITPLTDTVHPTAKIPVDIAKSQDSEQPQIILYKGTDTSQGRGPMLSNISAVEAAVVTMLASLGPRGLDKLSYDDKGATISNDGTTIIHLPDIEHPAAKTLVDMTKSQDSEVGGTVNM